MLRGKMTQLEAAHEWVNGFNAVPTQMIAKLMQADPDDWHEVTCPTVGDQVYVFDTGFGEVIEIYHKTCCKVKLENGSIWRGHMSKLEVEYEDSLPMWGTMWSFGDSCDEYWLDKTERDGEGGFTNGIAIMSQCGFRIFKSYEFGYFFGIDGAGYDFYESHWLPLYKARGLKWHNPEKDEAETLCD